MAEVKRGYVRALDLKHGRVDMTHGSGGRAMVQLISELFAKHLGNEYLGQGNDGAVLPAPLLDGRPARLVMSTDSHVVSPLFFPGGDIGCLAVHGTVNDVAVMGATPLYLAAGFILEEGLALSDLARIVESMAHAAKAAGVPVVTGDTKVVNRGCADKIFINTAGIGVISSGVNIAGANARPGDAVIVSGYIAEHGVAVLSRRAGIAFQTSVVCDCAPLWQLVKIALDSGAEIHTMRDPTRGGLATTVCDIARASDVGIRLQETAVPVGREVQGACDLLGLDPLTIANEGKVVVVCRGADAERVLQALHAQPLGKNACVIGEVIERPKGMALLRTAIGGERIIDMPTGEDLPRIC